MAAQNDLNSGATTRKGYPSFEEVWEKYFKPLNSQSIATGSGKINILHYVDDGGVFRTSSEQYKSYVPKGIFQFAYERLMANGYVDRKEEIHKRKPSLRCSSFVVALMAYAVPFISIYGTAKGLQLQPYSESSDSSSDGFFKSMWLFIKAFFNRLFGIREDPSPDLSPKIEKESGKQ